MAGQRKALIIANDTYEHEALQDLLAPAADAEALGRVLGDPQIGDFAVEVVRNEPSYAVQTRIEDLFSESRPDDLLLMHFSGHGLKSESGELFFAGSNTRPNRLGSTAISADFVRRCMRDSRSRSVVLLLDCCYGGAFAQGVRVRAAGDVHVLDSFPQERTGGRGRAVITASSAMEYAFEGDQLTDNRHSRPSVFTTALVNGLVTGDADRDEDGWVSLSELYDYLFDKVREQTPHQTPSRQFELEGELYLARSQRRRIRPVPIPADLRAAMTSADMYARLGAVSELRSRMASDDIPVAVGAYEALTELARTDVRYVADPAAAALREAAMQPVQTAMHFGQVEQGSPSPHQILQLSGPPIARACVLRPSHAWIRAELVAEGLDVSIDTSSAGSLHGSLDLKGPTGQAGIAIDIDLVSPSAGASRESSVPVSSGATISPASIDEPAQSPTSPPPPAFLHSPSETVRATEDDTAADDTDQPTNLAGRVPPDHNEPPEVQAGWHVAAQQDAGQQDTDQDALHPPTTAEVRGTETSPERLATHEDASPAAPARAVPDDTSPVARDELVAPEDTSPVPQTALEELASPEDNDPPAQSAAETRGPLEDASTSAAEEELAPAGARPPALTVPGDRATLEDMSPAARAAPEEAPLPPDSHEEPRHVAIVGGSGRRSRTTLVSAAGSAVAGIVLLLGASIPFARGSSQEALWRIVLAAAILGLLVTSLERPFKQPVSFVHGWNSVWFLFLALFVLKLHGTNIVDALDAFTALLISAALGNAAFAAFALRTKSSKRNSYRILSITGSLITVGLAVMAFGNANGSHGLSRGGGVILFLAALATMLEAVIALTGKASPGGVMVG